MAEDVISDYITKLSDNYQKTLIKSAAELQKQVASDPGNVKLQKALAQAMKELDAFKQPSAERTETLESVETPKEAIKYLKRCNRKVGRTKLFEDTKKGKLHRQTDGSFLLRDLDKYAVTLPYIVPPDHCSAALVDDRQRRKDEADIRLKEAQASIAEHKYAVQQGQYIPKNAVWLELAARAVAFRNTLKNTFESRILELITLTEGNASHSEDVVEWLSRAVDTALSEYSAPIRVEVDFFEALESDDAAETTEA